MSFTGRSSIEKDPEETKAAILAEISEYGVKLDEIKATYDEAIKKGADIEALNETITTLEALKSALTEDVRVLQDTKTSLDIPSLQATVADLKAQIDLLSKSVEVYKQDQEIERNKAIVLRNEITSISADIDTKKKDLADLIASYTEKDKMFDEQLNHKQAVYKSEIASLESRKATLLSEIDALDIQTETKRGTFIEISDKLDAVTVSFNDIDSKHTLRMKGLDAEYDKKKEELDAEMVEKATSLDAKEEELTTREGTVSLQEQKLKKERINLQNIKRQLEEAAGTSINVDL